MKVVALARSPKDAASAAKTLADTAGMTLAEARMRLAPEPPALLCRLPDDAANLLASNLRAAGLAALAVGTAVRRDRVIVRRVEPTATNLVLVPRAGEPLEVAWDDVAVLLRGASATRSQTETQETSQQLAIGTAIATGGLKMTKTTTKMTSSHSEDVEQSIFVFANDGRSAVLREHALEFAWLGKALQPSRIANMTTIATMLRERARTAFFDDRLLRLGRRPVPFLASGETLVATADMSSSRQDTAPTLDLLAEVMYEAVAGGLLG